tara:strand:+ start:245 stop:514 length:270 start_codon:yes stop_codon:yes gene_type:complete
MEADIGPIELDMETRRNVRMGGIGLASLIAMASVASAIIYIVYAAKFANSDQQTADQTDYLNSQLGYYGAVIGMLMLLCLFNGYHLMYL